MEAKSFNYRHLDSLINLAYDAYREGYTELRDLYLDDLLNNMAKRFLLSDENFEKVIKIIQIARQEEFEYLDEKLESNLKQSLSTLRAKRDKKLKEARKSNGKNINLDILVSDLDEKIKILEKFFAKNEI